MDISISEEDGDKLHKQLVTMTKLETVLQGLVTFADMRDDEDAGDWVIVAQTADFVRRNLHDIGNNIVDALDPGDTGDQ